MANKPLEETKRTDERPQGVSRRELFARAGVGVAGAVVCGAVVAVIRRSAPPSPPPARAPRG